MSKSNKGFISLCIPLLAILVIFSSCEDPGSVGSSFVNDPEVTFDTLSFNSISSENLNGYTGKFPYMSIGSFSDPIFGDITSTGMLKPSINFSAPDSIDIDGDNINMKLKVLMDSVNTYGDTLSTSEFILYEITSRWRGNSQRMNTGVTYDESVEIGRITLQNGQDSVTVDLSNDWKNKFIGYYNNESAAQDSLYQYDFGGLALVPTAGTANIRFLNSVNTQFLFLTADQSDTVYVELGDWAFDLNRSNINLPSGTTAMHTTIEEMMKLTYPIDEIKERYQGVNVLTAEVIFNEAATPLNSSLGTHEVRPNINAISLSLAVETQQAYDYQLLEPDFFASKPTGETIYRSNITNYFNNVIFGGETRNEFFIGNGANTGLLKSTLIYNNSAPDSLRPKLIITSLSNEE